MSNYYSENTEEGFFRTSHFENSFTMDSSVDTHLVDYTLPVKVLKNRLSFTKEQNMEIRVLAQKRERNRIIQEQDKNNEALMVTNYKKNVLAQLISRIVRAR